MVWFFLYFLRMFLFSLDFIIGETFFGQVHECNQKWDQIITLALERVHFMCTFQSIYIFPHTFQDWSPSQDCPLEKKSLPRPLGNFEFFFEVSMQLWEVEHENHDKKIKTAGLFFRFLVIFMDMLK